MVQQKIFPNVGAIAEGFAAVLLDAYGVFWGGGETGVLPGAKEEMAQLVAAGKVVGILSNTSQRVAAEKEKLRKRGLLEGIHFHFLLTSGEIAHQLLSAEKLPFKTPHKKFYVAGTAHPQFPLHNAIFEGTPYRETTQFAEADFIHLAVPHIDGQDQEDPERFRKSLQELFHQGLTLPMLCVNPDRFAHEGKPPRPVVRQGSLAALYAEMGGPVFYVGKPSRLSFEAAMQQLRQREVTHAAAVLMIGDTPETDVRGARHFGMAAALVTASGIMAERVAQSGLEAALAALTPTDKPHFLLERFAS